ncbi:MAG: hypothetical protein LBD64_06480 [Odoribacteraceae bacterium]|jgi:hypothetical protein|nr:hypothetical protein [Odoribacteraceae bacterium]
MKNDILLEHFTSAMREQLPVGRNLASTLSDFLCIGREAAYRRLRGEVPFTFAEAVIMAEKLNLSLDAIACNSREDSIPFFYTAISYSDSSDKNYELFLRNVNAYERAREDPGSELGIAMNMIPSVFTAKYLHLTRLRCYKWTYQHEGRENMIPYSELSFPDRFTELCRRYVRAVEGIKTTFIILDPMIFRYLINDIRYFNGVGLLLDEEKEKIQAELLLMLDDMERAATNGKYDSGNPLFFYISNINFESTYSYTVYKHGSVSCLSIFTLNVLASVDPVMFSMIREWVLSLKRLSTLISEAGEMPRRIFFKEQREIIGKL